MYTGEVNTGYNKPTENWIVYSALDVRHRNNKDPIEPQPRLVQ